MTGWLIAATGAGAEAGPVARALAEATGQAVEERSDGALGFAPDEATARRIAAGLKTRFGTGLTVAVEAAAPADWTTAWRDGLAVRAVGRLRLGPSWLLSPGPDTVVIDPEMAFGSGEHGSTRGALALLERHLPAGAPVLDLGSGSGILAIAAVKLGARLALGIEVDDEAVPIAEQNAVANQVADRTRFVQGDAAVLAPLAGPAGVVVSNILRIVNLALLEPIVRALAPGGIAIFAGMEPPEAAEFREALDRAGLVPIDEVIDEGWWSVAARRRGDA